MITRRPEMPYFRYPPPSLLNESTTGREIQYTVQEVKQIYNKSHEIDESFEFKTLSHDLIRQADSANYRDQIEPTIKTIIAEIDDIEPHFQKVADLFVYDRRGERERSRLSRWRVGSKWYCRHWHRRCYLRMISRRRW